MSKKMTISTNPGKGLVEHMSSALVTGDELNENEQPLDGFLAELKGVEVATGSDKDSFSLVDEPKTTESAGEENGETTSAEATGERETVHVQVEDDSPDFEVIEVKGQQFKVPKEVAEYMGNLNAMQSSATQKFQQASEMRKQAATDLDRISAVENKLMQMEMRTKVIQYCNEYDISQDDFVTYCNENKRDDWAIEDYITHHKTAVYENQAKLTKTPSRGKFARLFQTSSNRPESLKSDAPKVRMSAADFLRSLSN